MLRLIQAELIEYLYVFIVFRHHEPVSYTHLTLPTILRV